MSAPGPSPARGYLRFAALVLAVLALLSGVGWFLGVGSGGMAAVRAMGVGLGISGAASLLGGLPTAWAAGSSEPHRAASGLIVGIALRLLVALLAGAATVLSGWLPAKPLLYWLAGGYVALLGPDTWFALAALRPKRGVET